MLFFIGVIVSIEMIYECEGLDPVWYFKTTNSLEQVTDPNTPNNVNFQYSWLECSPNITTPYSVADSATLYGIGSVLFVLTILLFVVVFKR